MSGLIGYGGYDPVGDDETPAEAGNLNIGGTVVQAAPDGSHTCALLTEGRVRCWGRAGSLGYQEEEDIGDDESPASVGDVNVGGEVVRLAAGDASRCALLDGGGVVCWGRSSRGFHGNGSLDPIGDDEDPAEAGVLELGGPVAELAVANGGAYLCVLMESGQVRCWGWNAFGQLGLGHLDTIGDDEPASAADPVRVLE